MNADVLRSLAHLLRTQRVASLGTLRNGTPQVTMVSYVASADLGAFFLHLSGLARHTRSLEDVPRVGLSIAEADPGTGDPQQLARVSLQGRASRVEPEDPDLAAVRDLYLARFPDAVRLLALGDFAFYRIVPESGRYVAGFAQAYNVGSRDLAEAGSL